MLIYWFIFSLRKRYDDLKSAQIKLRKVVKPNLKSMEDERHILDTEITQLRSQIETQYQKYKEVKNGIKSLNEAIINKQSEIAHSPDLGSFIDPNDDDEVDQEIQLMKENKKSIMFEATRELAGSDHKLNLSTSIRKNKNVFERLKERLDKQHEEGKLEGQEVAEKVQLSQLTSSLEISLHGTNTYYGVNLEDSSPLELEFFEKILCFLEGRNVYNPTKLSEPGKNSKRQRLLMMSDDLHYFMILNKNQFDKMKVISDNMLMSASGNQAADQVSVSFLMVILNYIFRRK